MLKIIFLAFLASVNLLSFFLILPARLSINPSYVNLTEYFLYFHIIQITVLLLSFIKYKKLVLYFTLFFFISVFFLYKQSKVLLKFYSLEELEDVEVVNKGLKFVYVIDDVDFKDLACIKESYDDLDILFYKKDKKLSFFTKETSSIKNKINLELEDLFLDYFKVSNLDIYYLNTKRVTDLNLLSRRLAGIFRHKLNSLLILDDFSVPFERPFKVVIKAGELNHFLTKKGYPFLSGKSFVNHIFLSRDFIPIEQKITKKTCGVLAYSFNF